MTTQAVHRAKAWFEQAESDARTAAALLKHTEYGTAPYRPHARHSQRQRYREYRISLERSYNLMHRVGTDLGFAKDYLGKPIPAGAAPDMGPFELQP